jgi:sialate O-acetylesterase
MKYLIYFLFILMYFPSSANIRLPAVIGSNMVLQQRTITKLWGWGDAGEKVRITSSWKSTLDSAVVDGNGKWLVNIQTPEAGGPYSITVKGRNAIELENVMIGEVWICSGQSNMEWSYANGLTAMKEDVQAAYNPNIRFFHVQRTTANNPQENVGGSWTVCDSNTLKTFSAVAYYFGKRLNAVLNVPVGLINASWGGTPAETWTPARIVYSDSILVEAGRKLNSSPWWPVSPGYAFNGMIAPLTNYSIGGAIWYQGESNAGTASTYTRLLTSMIESWRTSWNSQFPFYFVQLAPFAYGNNNVGALLREAQVKTLGLHRTGMVVTTDLADDTTDIHPKDKEGVGLRLASVALTKTYGISVAGAISPMYRSMSTNGNQVTVAIENIGTGLKLEGKNATGFFISGPDQVFHPAQARITGTYIVVWSKDVPQPVAVRYAFSNTAIGNVFSREGLPLSPFRTDNWVVDTSPVK